MVRKESPKVVGLVYPTSTCIFTPTPYNHENHVKLPNAINIDYPPLRLVQRIQERLGDVPDHRRPDGARLAQPCARARGSAHFRSRLLAAGGGEAGKGKGNDVP